MTVVTFFRFLKAVPAIGESEQPVQLEIVKDILMPKEKMEYSEIEELCPKELAPEGWVPMLISLN